MSIPRGIRNHNPGNIRQNNIKWQGMRENPFDHEFVEFKSAVWGLRAMMKILLTYYRRYGLNDVQSIINRWAPPHENATDHYVYHVARRLRVKRFDALNLEDVSILIALAKSIVVHENGFPRKDKTQKTLKLAQKDNSRDWYDHDVYYMAAMRALEREPKSEQPKSLSLGAVPNYETKSAISLYAIS